MAQLNPHPFAGNQNIVLVAMDVLDMGAWRQNINLIFCEVRVTGEPSCELLWLPAVTRVRN